MRELFPWSGTGPDEQHFPAEKQLESWLELRREDAVREAWGLGIDGKTDAGLDEIAESARLQAPELALEDVELSGFRARGSVGFFGGSLAGYASREIRIPCRPGAEEILRLDPGVPRRQHVSYRLEDACLVIEKLYLGERPQGEGLANDRAARDLLVELAAVQARVTELVTRHNREILPLLETAFAGGRELRG